MQRIRQLLISIIGPIIVYHIARSHDVERMIRKLNELGYDTLHKLHYSPDISRNYYYIFLQRFDQILTKKIYQWFNFCTNSNFYSNATVKLVSCWRKRLQYILFYYSLIRINEHSSEVIYFTFNIIVKTCIIFWKA